MRPMRALMLTIALTALAALGPAGALAEPLPPFNGLMSFHAIQGPEGPEEFSWEVHLNEEEELQLVDESHAGIFWEDGTMAMSIVAGKAHDAEGRTVPTTLAVTQPNIITLTVHHRAGNPAAGGAPFTYPVTAGSGWEGGFVTYQVQMPPPSEVPVPAPLSGMVATCLVPNLLGRSLKASRRLLERRDCELGQVRGERGKGAKVVKQYRRPGSSVPPGTRVGVKLG
jgi:hypothetical protein